MRETGWPWWPHQLQGKENGNKVYYKVRDDLQRDVVDNIIDKHDEDDLTDIDIDNQDNADAEVKKMLNCRLT